MGMAEKEWYYTYVLYSIKDNKNYIGYTHNLTYDLNNTGMDRLLLQNIEGH